MHSFGLNYGADIILGNDNGRACTSKTTNFFKKMMKKQNFKVTENNPFAGAILLNIMEPVLKIVRQFKLNCGIKHI